MYTYQDLVKVGENDIAKGNLCRAAVNQFMSTKEYKDAKEGEAYYAKHNVTIEKFQKFLYTLSGGKVEDIWSANYKLKTLFFRRLTIQQVQYVLGNGLTLSKANNKKKLGIDFDNKLQLAAKKAMAEGVSFGFWNYDHLEVFSYVDTVSSAGFCPLYNEETSKLDAGIRFWFRRIGNDLIFRCTLYEADGYTDYKQVNSEDATILNAKRGYKHNIISSKDNGIEEEFDENYGTLPIIPLYVNDTHESELIGIREDIDCYDFIKSGLANVIDDNADVFWILQNSGGMDDPDLAQFIQRVKTVRAAMVDSDGGQTAEPHTVEVPYEARKVMLDLLRSDIYEDFGAADVKSLSAAQKTTQEIQAAYQAQDNKCDDFEYCLIEFVQQILALAGIDDNPTFVRSKIVNQNEQTNMILSCANYLPDEVIIKHLPFLTPEESDSIINDMVNKQYEAFNDDAEEDEPEVDTVEEDEE